MRRFFFFFYYIKIFSVQSSKVTPADEESNKQLRLGINDTLSVLSSSEYEANNKTGSQKGLNSAAEREKEDRAILSSLPVATVKHLDGYESQIGEAEPLPNSYVRFMERSGEELDGEKQHFCGPK